jgi:hypothetical protein
MTDTIAIDFVAGTHGHFLETTLNRFFRITPDMTESFTATGTSHLKTIEYQKNKLFWARHWFELEPVHLANLQKIISIRFTQDDLLLVSTASLLRTADFNINNDDLEIDTVNKLSNNFYQTTLEQIYAAYPFLDRAQVSIPRHVLREFYKFGFRNPDINGYWLKQQAMTYPTHCNICFFDFSAFYDLDQLVQNIKKVEKFVDKKFDFSDEFYQQHEKFLSFITYHQHKQQCDHVIQCVEHGMDISIPRLTLFQESYINGCLENIYHKEMPFDQDRYFTSTTDMLYYITNLAPNL